MPNAAIKSRMWLISLMEPADNTALQNASAGNGDFNMSRFYGQLSPWTLIRFEKLSQQTTPAIAPTTAERASGHGWGGAGLWGRRPFGATAPGALSWSRLSEQLFRVDKWSVCRG